jgi:hypothetical protein
VTLVDKDGYGKFLGEFLWRESELSGRVLGTTAWRHYAFWKLAQVVGKVWKPVVECPWELEDEAKEAFKELELRMCPGLRRSVQVPAPVPAPAEVPAPAQVSRSFQSLRAPEGPLLLDLSSDEDVLQEHPQGQRQAAQPAVYSERDLFGSSPSSPHEAVSVDVSEDEEDPIEQFSQEVCARDDIEEFAQSSLRPRVPGDLPPPPSRPAMGANIVQQHLQGRFQMGFEYRPVALRFPDESQVEELRSPELPLASGFVCPKQHVLQKAVVTEAIVATQGHTICDVCGRTVAPKFCVWHCELCIWDACLRCARSERVCRA